VVLVTVMVDRRMYPPLRRFFPSVGVAIDLAVIAGDLHFLADFYVRIRDHARAGAHIRTHIKSPGRTSTRIELDGMALKAPRRSGQMVTKLSF
jgi:hypothetical protein